MHRFLGERYAPLRAVEDVPPQRDEDERVGQSVVVRTRPCCVDEVVGTDDLARAALVDETHAPNRPRAGAEWNAWLRQELERPTSVALTLVITSLVEMIMGAHSQ